MVKDKIFMDLLIDKTTIVPALISSTLFMGGWAVSSLNLMFYGFLGVLLTLGVIIYRFTFCTDLVAKQLYEKLEEQKVSEFEKQLKILRIKISHTNDLKDDEYFDKLKNGYDSLLQFLKKEKTNQLVTEEIITQFDSMFRNCIKRLEESLVLRDSLKGVSRKNEIQIKKDIKILMDEIEKDVEQFLIFVGKIKILGRKDICEDTDNAKDRLAVLLQAAEESQKELEKFNNPNDLSRFEEFKNMN